MNDGKDDDFDFDLDAVLDSAVDDIEQELNKEKEQQSSQSSTSSNHYISPNKNDLISSNNEEQVTITPSSSSNGISKTEVSSNSTLKTSDNDSKSDTHNAVGSDAPLNPQDLFGQLPDPKEFEQQLANLMGSLQQPPPPKDGEESPQEKELRELWENMFKTLQLTPDQVASQQAAPQSNGESSTSSETESKETSEASKDFSESIDDAIDSISRNARNQQQTSSSGAGGAPDDILSQIPGFEELLKEGGGLEGLEDLMKNFNPTDPNSVDKLVENMMSEMMTKEVMYEPLKDVCAQYPKWLEEHHGSVDEDLYKTYESQYELFQKLVTAFDEDADQSIIMELMAQMQELGQPPKEIMEELMPGVDMSQGGNPFAPALGGMPGLPPGGGALPPGFPPMDGLDPEKIKEMQKDMQNCSIM